MLLLDHTRTSLQMDKIYKDFEFIAKEDLPPSCSLQLYHLADEDLDGKSMKIIQQKANIHHLTLCIIKDSPIHPSRKQAEIHQHALDDHMHLQFSSIFDRHCTWKACPLGKQPHSQKQSSIPA